MPRARQPTETLRKHLTQAEKAERRAQELKVPAAEKAVPPKWLGRGFDEATARALKAEFKKLGTRLITAGLYTDLDADTLAHYLVARHQWELATVEAEKALQLKTSGGSDAWGKVQARYFADARRCANELGLTMTARCKLVVPEKEQGGGDTEDEFTRILRQRMAGSA